MDRAVATNYSRGRAFEYRARDALKKRGAVYVMRAAQSKGIIDLLALWPRAWRHDTPHYVIPPWLVQAKYSITGKAGRLTAADTAELIAIADQTGAIPVSATQGPKGRGVVFTDLRTKEVL